MSTLNALIVSLATMCIYIIYQKQWLITVNDNLIENEKSKRYTNSDKSAGTDKREKAKYEEQGNEYDTHYKVRVLFSNYIMKTIGYQNQSNPI